MWPNQCPDWGMGWWHELAFLWGDVLLSPSWILNWTAVKQSILGYSGKLRWKLFSYFGHVRTLHFNINKKPNVDIFPKNILKIRLVFPAMNNKNFKSRSYDLQWKQMVKCQSVPLDKNVFFLSCALWELGGMTRFYTHLLYYLYALRLLE